MVESLAAGFDNFFLYLSLFITIFIIFSIIFTSVLISIIYFIRKTSFLSRNTLQNPANLFSMFCFSPADFIWSTFLLIPTILNFSFLEKLIPKYFVPHIYIELWKILRPVCLPCRPFPAFCLPDFNGLLFCIFGNSSTAFAAYIW